MTSSGWCESLIRAAQITAGERVAVVVDTSLAEEGSELADACADAGAEPRLALWKGKRPLARPPEPVRRAVDSADVYILILSAPRGDEAAARFELMETTVARGGRAIFMGFVDGELLRKELSEPFPDLSATALRLRKELEGADTLHVRGAAGTDLVLRVTGRRWVTDALPLRPGEVANFPGGEIFVAPHRDGADGLLVADLTVPYTVEGLVDEPVTARFERGRITSIEGGRAAALLRRLVEQAGPGGDVIAEFGIGFNPALQPRGHIMLDEKCAGTAHVAIGRNTGSYGGDNEATIHVDCVFSDPSVEVDGRPLRLL